MGNCVLHQPVAAAVALSVRILKRDLNVFCRKIASGNTINVNICHGIPGNLQKGCFLRFLIHDHQQDTIRLSVSSDRLADNTVGLFIHTQKKNVFQVCIIFVCLTLIGDCILHSFVGSRLCARLGQLFGIFFVLQKQEH